MYLAAVAFSPSWLSGFIFLPGLVAWSFFFFIPCVVGLICD